MAWARGAGPRVGVAREEWAWPGVVSRAKGRGQGWAGLGQCRAEPVKVRWGNQERRGQERQGGAYRVGSPGGGEGMGEVGVGTLGRCGPCGVPVSCSIPGIKGSCLSDPSEVSRTAPVPKCKVSHVPRSKPPCGSVPYPVVGL